MDTVIVSRHTGAVEWLRRQGITGEVIAHASADNVRGKHVIGALPLHLASLAAKITTIDMPALPVEWRGRDLTPEEMDIAGATLATYVVRSETEFVATVVYANFAGLEGGGVDDTWAFFPRVRAMVADK